MVRHQPLNVLGSLNPHAIEVVIHDQLATQVDIVRSGTLTPTVNAAIGTTYLPKERAQPGTKIEIDIRGKRVGAEVVKMPFVPHRTKK